MMTVKIVQFLTSLATEEDGVTAIEYALLAALIFAVIVAAVALVGRNLAAFFSSLAASFP